MSERQPLVLLVEDEASIAEPFAEALVREGFEAQVAGTIEEARSRMSKRAPDVVVLDIGLPDGDGRELCRELRRDSAVPVIMLTARGTESDRIVGLELGADDYVVKPFSAAEVSARIRAVLRRSGGTPSEIAENGARRFGELTVDIAARRVCLGPDELVLSRKEFDLLERLIADAGRVVRREDLMSDVWDANWFGSTKTLDVHVGFLRRKLGDDPQDPHYVQTVRGVGFRFAAPDGPGSP